MAWSTRSTTSWGAEAAGHDIVRSRRAGGALLVAALAGALPSLDTSVNIALPAITDAFHLDVGEVSWIVVSYVLTYAALLLGCGRLADRVGHRRVLLAGLATSVAGFAACASAPTFPWLVAARTVQGAGAGLLLAAAPALVTLAVAPELRSRALATFQLCTAAGFAVGPPIGGLLLGRWSWPSVWWYRVPVAVALIGLVGWAAHTARTAAVRGEPAERPAAASPVPLDLPGVATLAVTLGGLLLALTRGRELGWTSALVLGSLLVGLAAGVAFVAIERRSPAPILDLSLLRRGGFALANALNLAANASWFVVLLLVPYYLLTVRGLGTVAGGVALAATPVGMAAASPAAGRLAQRLAPGPLCAAGLGIEAAGLAAVSRLVPTTPMAIVLGALALVGLGAGLFLVPNQSFVMGSIPRAAQGVAGGVIQTTRTVGVLLGVAGGGTLFEARTAAFVPPAAIAGDPVATADARFMAGFRDVFVAAALTAGTAALVALLRRGAQAEPPVGAAVVGDEISRSRDGTAAA